MPLGEEPDLESRVVVDFPQIHDDAIQATIGQCGLEALRGDEGL
jgi:hypothetical protein